MADKQIAYPTNQMRATASQILTNAHNALDAHQTAWNEIQAHIDAYPESIRILLRAAVEPYDKRLRASYHWQTAVAHTLANAADQMDLTDQEVSQGFSIE